jgi:hypothetical protein
LPTLKLPWLPVSAYRTMPQSCWRGTDDRFRPGHGCPYW